MSFASEQPVSRWFGSEVLQVDGASVNASRIENGLGVLLFNHNRSYVLGKILRYWVDETEHKAYAEVEFDDDEESERIWKKVLSGTLRGVSVGYGVDNWEEVGAGKTATNGRVQGPAYVAVRWSVAEISIVSVPADDSVGVGREMEQIEEAGQPAVNEKREEQNMGEENKNLETNAQGRESAPAATPVAPAVDAQRAIDQERTRCAEITALCRDFEMDPTEFISGKRSVAEVQAEILRGMREKNKPTETANIDVREEDSVKFRSAAADAILLRSGMRVATPAAGASDLRHMRLRDLAVECLERDGNSKARYLRDEDLIREALTGAGAFAGILSNVANKSLSDGYAAAPATFDKWCGVGSNPDFKAATHYRLSEAGELQQMTETGEFKHDVVTEDSTSKSVLTYGRSFSLTRKAIINDDLSALTRIPQRYAAAARRGINALVYKTLATQAGLFTSQHGNLAGTAAALSVESLGLARKAMRVQKNLRNKEILNIVPEFLLAPAALETKAEQLFGSIADPASSNANVRNPFVNKFQIITDAELDQYSETAWYLAAAAGLVDTLEVTYLNGQQTPTLESQVAFDVLGMKWRIFIDYGVTVLDYRGLYKNAGQ